MRHELTYFKSDRHRTEYQRVLSKVKRQSDPYWQATLYVLAAVVVDSSSATLAEQMERFLKFQADEVDPDLADNLPALSGGERRLTRLALHLWNDSNEWTVMDLSGLDARNLDAALHAIRHLVSNVG